MLNIVVRFSNASFILTYNSMHAYLSAKFRHPQVGLPKKFQKLSATFLGTDALRYPFIHSSLY